MSGRQAGLAVLVAGLVGLPAGRAASAPGNACRSAAHASGTTIAAASSTAVVFIRNGDYFGCAYRTGRVRRLPAICCDAERVKLAGVYAAYVYAGTALGDESDKIGIYDLRTGRRRDLVKLDPSSEGSGPEIDSSSTIVRFVVSSRGGVAWTQPLRHADGTLGPEVQLRAVGERRADERLVDSGDVSAGSLTLTHGRPAVLTWKNAGVVHRGLLDPSVVPPRPRPVAPANRRDLPKSDKGVVFSVRARSREKAGSLGIEIRTPEDGVAPDGSFYHPYEEESGRLVRYALKQVTPRGTLWRVRVPNIAFYRSGVTEFSWHAYRILPRSQCEPMKTGALDCFEESVTREFTYNAFR